MSYTRFAIYFVPPHGALAEFGARWLGWDLATGSAVAQPGIAGLATITRTPRKYGFHGTLKPPFRLADGCDPDGLARAVQAMAATCAPARCEGLHLSRIGRFLALTPVGDTGGIERVAATCVRALDDWRAPPDAAELSRRRRARLTERQDALLTRWGYPYVMEEFRFHMTLTGRLAPDEVAQWHETATAHMPDLPAPFVMDAIALVGERKDGHFELIQCYTLTG
ncbi:DUF1045 domain-containing protein [Sedimentitalea sp. XS_ASV28]|uniref:DUF1045 domain-containing protein n=1 Tax=Sedimentitalea sp. XS_ASV28 TaxID=3241296 RepID=UPI0035199CC8